MSDQTIKCLCQIGRSIGKQRYEADKVYELSPERAGKWASLGDGEGTPYFIAADDAAVEQLAEAIVAFEERRAADMLRLNTPYIPADLEAIVSARVEAALAERDRKAAHRG